LNLSAVNWRLDSLAREWRLRRVIFCVFTKSDCDAFSSVVEAEPFQATHSIEGTWLIFVIDKCDALSVLVSRKTDFIESGKTLEHCVELLFCDVLRDVADVKTNISFSLRRRPVVLV